MKATHSGDDHNLTIPLSKIENKKTFNTKNKRTINNDCPFNYARRDSNSRPFGS